MLQVGLCAEGYYVENVVCKNLMPAAVDAAHWVLFSMQCCIVFFLFVVFFTFPISVEVDLRNYGTLYCALVKMKKSVFVSHFNGL